MKKKLFAGTAVLVLILLAAILSSRAFPIQADGSNLKEQAVSFLNRGSRFPVEMHMKLYDSVILGKKRFTLMEIGEDLGIIRQTRGWNGRYRIDSVGYGGGNFQEEIVPDGDRRYFLIGGRNACFGIAEIVAALGNRTYRLEVPEGDRFLVFTEVDAGTAETHVLPDALTFYGRAGEDLTEQVPWN